jgi:cell division protein FtsA
MDEHIIHEIPQEYQMDDLHSALNPVGLYGRKLGTRSLIIIVPVNYVRGMIKAVNQAGYDVKTPMVSSVASSDVLLTDEQKKSGCVLVEMGSKCTTVLSFKDGILRSFRKIDFGGDDLTTTIASALNLPFELAEDIKKSYALCSPLHDGDQEEILVKRESAYIPIRRKMICDCLQEKFLAFLDQLQKVLVDLSNEVPPQRGFIISGGGALLSGLIERVGQETKVPVSLGKVAMSLSKTFGKDAVFASAIGLASQGFKSKSIYQPGTFEPIPWTKRLNVRLIELYQEYF